MTADHLPKRCQHWENLIYRVRVASLNTTCLCLLGNLLCWKQTTGKGAYYGICYVGHRRLEREFRPRSLVNVDYVANTSSFESHKRRRLQGVVLSRCLAEIKYVKGIFFKTKSRHILYVGNLETCPLNTTIRTLWLMLAIPLLFDGRAWQILRIVLECSCTRVKARYRTRRYWTNQKWEMIFLYRRVQCIMVKRYH